MAVDEQFDWGKNTKAFSANGVQPAQLMLHQVDDDEFELRESFTFTNPATGRTIPVQADLLGRTDLASIPTFLGWFARRHGRHTFAALMHDQLITTDPARLRAQPHMPRPEADLLFRDALVACQVPLVKAWIMWTGVTLGSRWSMKPWGAAAIVLWFAAALTGNALLVLGLLTGSPLAVAVALVAPVPSAALWGHQYPAGITAGYAFWFVVAGSAPAWLAYQVYRGVEWTAIPLRRLRPRNRDIPLPPPAPFDKR